MERTGLDEQALCALAQALGTLLQPGDVVLLDGPMGAGKTTFCRALARGLGVNRPDRVRSPTYTLCLVHDGPRPLAHVDLFRLALDDEAPAPGSVRSAAFEALGLDALTEGEPVPDLVVVVEWAELWAGPPRDALGIVLALDPADVARRSLLARGSGARGGALLRAWASEIGN